MILNYILKIPFVRMFKITTKVIKGKKKKHVIICLLFTLSILLNSMSPLLYKWIIDRIQFGNDIIVYLSQYIIALILLKTLEWGLYYPAYVMQRNITFKITSRHLLEMFHFLLHKDILFLKKENCGILQNKIRKSYDGLKDFFMDEFLYLKISLKLIFAVSMMIYFVPFFGIISLILGLLAIKITSKYDTIFTKHIEEIINSENHTFAFISDSLHNSKTIKSFNIEETTIDIVNEKICEIKNPFIESCLTEFRKLIVVDFIIIFIYILITGGFILQSNFSGEQYIIGSLVALISYTNHFTSVFLDFTWINSLSANSLANYKAYDIEKANNSLIGRNKKSTNKNEWETISLINLKPSLNKFPQLSIYTNKGISFKIHKNEKIALLGKNGIGKSTLLYILKGLYHVDDETELYIDNVKYPFEWLKFNSVLGIQDIEVFHGSVLYNITLGLPVDYLLVEKTCTITCLDSVLKNKNINLDYIVDPNGNNFSGGEKQRLMLTRYIYHSQYSSVLFLDEPISNIDSNTAEIILKNLVEEKQTLVMTIHNNDLLHYFNRIILLSDNGISFDGNYSDYKQTRF